MTIPRCLILVFLLAGCAGNYTQTASYPDRKDEQASPFYGMDGFYDGGIFDSDQVSPRAFRRAP